MEMNKFKSGEWVHLKTGRPLKCICYNCNNMISSNKYYETWVPGRLTKSLIHICPHCNAPIVRDYEGKHVISPLIGKNIKKLPEDIERIYLEIRKSMQANCFNGAIMLMRKLIMHIAVEEGADEGKNFTEYINFLCDEGVVPRKSKGKADLVRTLGNGVNHQIEDSNEEDAKNCLDFLSLLLMANYEFADEESDE